MKKPIIVAIISISVLFGLMPVHANPISVGSVIKGSGPAVYFVNADGKRYVFPNEDTFYTWYDDYRQIRQVTDRELSVIPMGGTLTYRPGSRMLKLANASTVYAVSRGGVLHPIINESVALAMYGKFWNAYVDELPETLFSTYTVGDMIIAAAQFAPQTELANAKTISNDRIVAAAVDPVWSSLGPNLSGTVTAVAVDQTNPSIAYAGTYGGGVFKTTNRGESWTSVTSNLRSMKISAIAIDPVDPNIVYAATGEMYTSASGYQGVYVSKDAGKNWALMTNSLDVPFHGVSTITIDQKDGKHVYLAGDAGVYETKDAGKNWNKILDGFIQGFVVSAIDPATLIATGSNTLVTRSTDGGAHWTKLTGWDVQRGFPVDNPWFSRVTIAQSTGESVVKNAASVLYVAMNDPFKMFRSNDSGDTWQELARQPGSGMSNFTLAADPDNADTVFTGGNTLRYSTDGGWLISEAQMEKNGIRTVAFAPSNPHIMYAGTNAGIEVSLDGGLSWTVKNNGLAAAEVTSIAFGTGAKTIYGAAENYSPVKTENGSAWNQLSLGQASSLVSDPTNRSIVYAVSADGHKISRSNDSGNTFVPAGNNLPGNTQLSSLAHDPSKSGTLYVAAGTALYTTDDFGGNWTLVAGNSSASNITSIAIDDSDSSVYVGRADGTVGMVKPLIWNLYKEANAKPIADMTAKNGVLTVALKSDWGTRIVRLEEVADGWVPKDITADLPEGGTVNAIALDKANADTIYVGVSNGIYVGKTNDGVTWNWTKLSNNIPVVDVTDVAVHPETGRVVIATSGRGVFELK